LDEISCGNFIGHYSVARERSSIAWAWFLLAAQAEGACGVSA
jgi:hypothetical protein